MALEILTKHTLNYRPRRWHRQTKDKMDRWSSDRLKDLIPGHTWWWWWWRRRRRRRRRRAVRGFHYECS